MKRTILLSAILLFTVSNLLLGDIEFSGGVTAEIDYVVDGTVWIYDAHVTMYEPAHIQGDLGYVVTGSEAVLDIYGGIIDQQLLISFEDLDLPEGIVTVYGTDFAVDDDPIDPNTTELFLQGQTLSGVYGNGTPFAFPVDCVIVGGSDFIYTQTVKLGWITSEPEVIEIDVDINPRRCPNPLNVKGKGFLSVAILGSEDFDVYMIDVATLELEGIKPIRTGYKDVAAPVVDGEICECTTEKSDGYLDLTLKFDTQEIVDVLGDVNDGEILELDLIGSMLDGTPIEGEDCVVIINKAKK